MTDPPVNHLLIFDFTTTKHAAASAPLWPPTLPARLSWSRAQLHSPEACRHERTCPGLPLCRRGSPLLQKPAQGQGKPGGLDCSILQEHNDAAYTKDLN
jgi:hypothetical protein